MSSYGFGGTNAHVVLQEAPRRTPGHGPADAVDRPAHLLALSARDERGLREQARRFAGHLAAHPEAPVADICHTAAVGRSHFPHRLAVVGGTGEELRRGLDAFAAGETSARVPHGRVAGHARPKVAFLFTGQGSQYRGMGAALYAGQPVFREALDRCAALLDPRLDRPLTSVLFAPAADDSPLDETRYTQPALFALEYALAELWRSWGVEPDAVLGHSVGEYVAACVAGVFTLEDGLRLIGERGRLMQALPRDGAMAVAFAPEPRVRAALAGHEDRVSLAAINGPANTVISGTRDSVRTILEGLQAEGIAVHRLNVSHAFHSPLMEPMLEGFARVCGEVEFRAPRLPLISNLTGRALERGEVPDAGYWLRHVREPVKFAAGIDALWQLGYRLFVEVGPNPVLLGMGRSCVPDAGAAWLPSLRQGQDDWQTILHSLGTLYTRGVDPAWDGFDQPYPGERVPLPTYPFARTRHWIQLGPQPGGRAPAAPRAAGQVPTGHPLLGRALDAAHRIFESELDAGSPAYLADHRVEGAVLLPAAAYVELGLAAAAAAGDGPSYLADLELRQALPLADDRPQSVQVVLSPGEFGESSVQVYSRPAQADGAAPRSNPWVLHAAGRVLPGSGNGASPGVRAPLDQIRARCPEELAGADYYAELGRRGLEYGPAFRGVERVWRGDGEALGAIRVPEPVAAELERYQLHPTLLDACFQVLAAAAPAEARSGGDGGIYVPVGVDRVRVHGRPGPSLWSHARFGAILGLDGGTIQGDIRLIDEAGDVLAEVTGLRARRLDRGPRAAADELAGWFYELHWRPQGRRQEEPERQPAGSAGGGNWLIFADATGVGDALAERLAARGDGCVLVRPGAAYERLDAGAYRVNPERPDELQRLLEQVLGRGRPACRGIVHLWSLDAPAGQETAASLATAQSHGCGSVLRLVQGLADIVLPEPPRLWLVTGGTQPAGAAAPLAVAPAPLWGLGRVIAREHPELRCACVDLDPAGAPDGVESLCRELLADDQEDQVALRGAERYVARLVPRPSRAADRDPERPAGQGDGELAIPPHRPFRLESATSGILDSLRLRPVENPPPGPGEVAIQVRAVGLNFRDVMKAMGIYPSDDDVTWLGDECAGTVVALGAGVEGYRVGDEVVALAPASFASFATTRASLVVPKPQRLSFAEAATIPVAFTTAYYSLHRLARLGRGERVLIHAAAGGVGLAAVQVARWLGAEVFATAGSPEKRDYLRSLGVAEVFDSRSLAFADEILERTGGRGVDVVLNSLAGEALLKSLEVLAPCGRFVEIGKRDVYQDTRLGLRAVKDNISLSVVDMDQLSRERPAFVAGLLAEVMDQVAAGAFDPLPLREFPIARAVDAFRQMAQAKQIGKLVLSLPADRAGEAGPAGLPGQFRPDGTYLVTGGLGALGLLVARWLVERGARHLALVGRSRPSPAAAAAVAELERAGAAVTVACADVSREEEVRDLLAELGRTRPPLRGVVHAAGTLDDGLLLDLDPARFRSVLAPKVDGAWNLHTQTLGAELDCFVLFSSVAALLGSPGQGNYAAANAFLDALAHHRRALGLPAVAINWGPWGEVGMAAQAGRGKRLALQGIESIQPERGLELLTRIVEEDPAQVAVLRVDWARWGQLYPALRRSPLLAEVAPDEETGAAAGPSRQALDALLREPAEGRQRLLESYIQQQVARVLEIEPSQLDPHEPLGNLGLDSLMGIQLHARLENELDVALPRAILLQAPTISQLAGQVLPLLVPPAADPTPPAPVEQGAGAPLLLARTNPQARLRLFCLPYAGNGARIYRDWPDALPALEVCPVELPGRGARAGEAAFTGMAELVRELAEALLPDLDKPFALFGHSMGALVAFELARRLRARHNLTPAHLFVAGHRAPQLAPAGAPLHALPDLALLAELRRLNGIPAEVAEDAELMRLLLPTLRADLAVCETYEYSPEPPLACPITALGGLQDERVRRHDLEPWREQATGPFSLRMLPGDHFFLHSSRQLLLQVLAEELQALADGADRAEWRHAS